MRRLVLVAAAVLSASLSGCKGDCEDGQSRACYSGEPATKNIGVCRDGIQVCVDQAWGACQNEELPTAEICDLADNDCNGQTDEGVLNVCGGCAVLPAGIPNELCTNCGHWTCESPNSLVCKPPTPAPGAVCDSPDGCPGRWKCDPADGTVTCRASSKNECGICGAAKVEGIGTPCVGTNGCDGELDCDGTGEGTECQAAPRNNCGVCGEADVLAVGSSCRGTNGCEGEAKCDEAGTGSVCDAPTKNECGACGGPALPDKDKPCGTGECVGVLTCNTAGTALTCVVAGPAIECASVDGCPGTKQCNAAGELLCNAPTKNACGKCGGAAVTGIGDVCNPTTCPGRLACNATSDGTVCIPDAVCVSTTDHVVISEIGADGKVFSDDEFVELYNPTAAEVSIAGWRLFYTASSSGSTSAIHTFPSAAKIASHGYYLVSGFGYTHAVDPDEIFSASSVNLASSATGKAAVWLTKTSTKPTSATSANVVDMVGYQVSSTHEGSDNAPSPGAGTSTAQPSIERKANVTSTAASMKAGGADATAGNAEDTNDNKNDFYVRAQRDPQNKTSPHEP